MSATPRESSLSVTSLLSLVTKYQSYLVLLLIFVIAAIVSPERRGENVFLGSSNLLNVVRFASENGIIAIGMTLVIITAGIDLSVGSVLALCAVTAAYMMMTQDAGILLTILTVLAVGLGAGLINGVVSTKLRIQPFIVTLAMMSVARGAASLLADGYAIPLAYGDGEGLAPPQFRTWFGGNLEIGGWRIPVSIFYFVAIALIASFVLNRTRFGRHIYAVGGNETASHLSGIKTDRVKIAVYAITGALVGIAAMLHAALVSQGSHIDGQGYELNAIAAVVIGGTNLMGGIGTIGGTFIGAIILSVLDNILGLKNVSSEYQQILKGLIIVLAVVLQRKRAS